MNEAFFALPKEKQYRIINAAIEVFAKNPYKRASTDDRAYYDRESAAAALPA